MSVTQTGLQVTRHINECTHSDVTVCPGGTDLSGCYECEPGQEPNADRVLV